MRILRLLFQILFILSLSEINFTLYLLLNFNWIKYCNYFTPITIDLFYVTDILSLIGKQGSQLSNPVSTYKAKIYLENDQI